MLADLWGEAADSYWCSNASAGGWAEVDRECAVAGQLQIPDGVTVNLRHPAAPSARSFAKGALLHAWHSQSWAMHMFEVANSSVSDDGATLTATFSPGGGKQGGRNWCRCDQCGYAGPWCGQHQTPPDNNDTRLISGTWMVENVLAELDA